MQHQQSGRRWCGNNFGKNKYCDYFKEGRRWTRLRSLCLSLMEIRNATVLDTAVQPRFVGFEKALHAYPLRSVHGEQKLSLSFARSLGHSLSKERRVFSVVDCFPMYSFHGRQVLSSSAYLPNGGAITCAMACSWVSRMLSSTLAELSWAEWMVVASGTQDFPCSLFRSFLRTSLFSFFVLIWSELRNAWMM